MKSKNNYKKILIASLMGAAVLGTTSCRDDFADINTSPSQVTTPQPTYLFAQAVLDFENSGYTYWFYNAPMMFEWAQMATPTDSYTATFTTTTASGDQGSQYLRTLKYVNEVKYYQSTLSEEEAAQYNQILACLNIMTAYLGIFDSDMYGDLQFTEAAQALHGGTLTPAYDTLESLYDLWLTQLDEAINTLTTATNQIELNTQDVVYGGDMAKWAKLANSVKLRIASRLLIRDRARALQIAQQVATASCGYIDTMDDAMLFNKSTHNTSSDDYAFHWSNGFMDGTAASQRVMNFMVENQDPRVRFCYQKNEWNSRIVQAFYDQDREIPSYIEENVEYTTDANGHKQFVAWKGLGEPWVRYYGIPVEFNARDNAAQYGDYFNYDTQYMIYEVGGTNYKSYRPYSMFQQQMIIGRYYTTTIPTVPGGPVIERTENRPWYGLYMGAAEVNLSLAEFALLGAALPQSAEYYYNRGLEASVREYDRLAGLNQIAYYGTTYDYDPNEVSIELKDGEIEAMMANEDYQLTGSQAEQLEKVYIQQMLNFTLYPNEQFVTARRTGLPKFNSNLIARENFTVVPVTQIPRRFDTGIPLETELTYQIELDALARQGLTPTSAGPNGQILHDERLWQDVGAPEWGAGPQL
ncbi:SusD/RagB family nutrient-binding outer membrane lipoprotein [Parabacteroides sp. An277]|uniref:SusD/RagB family nutrient-binding outer membrane lipoprotein n=1 Tax=Parabacteroides sp. An277 TaxID=1965619 RepID=UPI000B370DAC|nr:SusD/RagB family nutrient-binding outer membrane lipoprotein [Parabacteroides sp. An277]OUO54892.1 SusD/RagB family nutrient-binding outer membrane lipoprotein [Parabacteroides sp. An277]